MKKSDTADRVTEPLPLAVLVLAAGTFLMGTSEFVVAGVLPELSRDLGVGIPAAGLNITVFALGMIVGAPAMSLLTLRLPRRLTLALALIVFAAGHVVVAVSPDLTSMLAARFVTAIATGAFWSVAAVAAMHLVGPAGTARALAVVLGGGVLATVIGVPAGAVLGHVVGWRGAFWLLATLALACTVLVWFSVPDDRPGQARPPLRTEFVALRSGRLWLVFLACVGINAAVMSAYSFIAPVLTDRAGLSIGLLPLALAGFGVGAVLGNAVAGRLGDRRPHITALAGAAVATAALLSLSLWSTSPVPAVLAITVAGAAGLGVNPILIALAGRAAGSAPTLATALCTSAFNAGTAMGTWTAGSAIHRVGPVGAPITGTAFGLLLLLPVLVALLRLEGSPPLAVDLDEQV